MTDQKDRDVIIKLVKWNPTSKKIIDKLDEVPLTQDIIDALFGANAPSGTNVFVTIKDLEENSFNPALMLGGM
jgi:hypothetical protein